MMKKLLSFLLSFLSVAVFFSCNNEQKEFPSLDVNSKYIRINTTIGLSSTRSLEITAEHSGDDGQQMRATIDFANDTWNNRTNKPDLYVVVGSKPVVKVSNSNYSYRKNGSTSSLHLALSLQYDNETDDVRLYLMDKTISVDRDNGTLTFPNQNEIVSPLNGDGTKPAYKLIFYGKTTIANLKTANAGFNLKPLGTLVLFSTNNQSGSAISIADNTSVSLTTDCFVFEGSVNMRTGLNSSTETNSQTLTFTLSNGGEAVANSSRGNIYGLYVLGKSKTGGTITLPLTDQFTATKTVAHNFQTEYNGKTVGINLDAGDDPTKYFVVEVARNSNTGRDYTQWYRNVSSGLRFSYRALDERGEPIGEWVPYEELPNNGNNYLARMYDYKNNSQGDKYYSTLYEHNFQCPRNTVKVVQWGKMEWRNAKKLFENCRLLTSIRTTDEPNFNRCNNFSYMFYECRKFNEPLNFRLNARYMQFMFYNCSSFNQVVNFDNNAIVSINYMKMFSGCTNFNNGAAPGQYNRPIIIRPVHPIVYYPDLTLGANTEFMFQNCRNFNQTVTVERSFDYGAYTAKHEVYDMAGMFYGCSSFNNGEAPGRSTKPLMFYTWYTKYMSNMFNGCSSFNQSVSNFNTSNVTDMYAMFSDCTNFNQSVSNFNTSNVTNMSSMFSGCTNFNQSVSNFNTSNVTDMSSMFYNCIKFNQPVSNFNTSNVTDMSSMFYNCIKFNQPVSNFNTRIVRNMARMFTGCRDFNQSVSNFNTSNVTNMARMFTGCWNFNQSLSNFNTGNVTDMSSMFFGCFRFNQNIRNWNVQNVRAYSDFHKSSALTQANCPPKLW